MKLSLTLLVLVAASCAHKGTPINKSDSSHDFVNGPMHGGTDPIFLKDDPASKIKCAADTDCPTGALCHPRRQVCFTSYPEMRMISIDVKCPLVPAYFALDSSDLVEDAQKWLSYDARCLKARGAAKIVLKGYADARGERAYNVALSKRRADAVREFLQKDGVSATAEGKGDTDPVIDATTEKAYAYNRRVELVAR